MSSFSPLNVQTMPVKTKNLVQGYFPPADSKYGDAARHAAARYYVPPSQREWANSWNPTKQQNFIDSIMQNFPIPSIICNRDEDGRMGLYEGRHRTETLWRFRNGHLCWNGKTYDELSEIERHIFNERELIVIVIEGATLDQLSEIFERLNAGSPLSDSDKFWNRRHTPLVRLTQELLIASAGLRHVWGDIDMTTRGHLANYVALAAGMVLGPNCFTTSYMRLFDHLELSSIEEETARTRIASGIQDMISLYEEANTRFPLVKKTQLSKYRKAGFINAYFLSELRIVRGNEGDVSACREKWIQLIGHLRNPETSKATHAALITKGAQNLTETKIMTVLAQVNSYFEGSFEGSEESLSQSSESDDE